MQRFSNLRLGVAPFEPHVETAVISRGDSHSATADTPCFQGSIKMFVIATLIPCLYHVLGNESTLRSQARMPMCVGTLPS